MRNNWTRAEIADLFGLPFTELVFRAAEVHRSNHAAGEVQLCTLLSIKTGGCPEDCGYCSQSAHADTGLKAEKLMDADAVISAAREAKAHGSQRFCMGAAWRSPKDKDVPALCAMVREVKGMGLETCMTLGMLTGDQAQALADAGLDYYNHNIDTSPEYYGAIITTRTFQDRLDTLEEVRKAGMAVCCGGIVGMGESREDRVGFLHALATLPAGRESMSESTQALCFLAGANSIFTGDRLLTTPNAGDDADAALFAKLGLKALAGDEPMRADSPSPWRGEGWGEGALRSSEPSNAEHPHPTLSLQGEGFRAAE